jgi:N-acetyltransferase 10
MAELSYLVTPFDLKRLESYAHNTLDYHVILDLLPTVAAYFFDRRLAADLNLSPVQASILLGLGLQRKSIEDVGAELGLPVNQALALFIKAIRKLSAALQAVQKQAIADELPAERTPADVARKQGLAGATKDWQPLQQTLEAELEEAGDDATRKMKEMKRAMIDSLDLDQ